MTWRRRQVPALFVALLGLALSGAAAAAFSRVFVARLPVEQPLRFSHATHVVGEEMDCTDCHGDAEHKPYAGLPDVQFCLDCHKNSQGEDPDEELVREFARQRQQIPFRPVTRNVGHVYFSHRMHMVAENIGCDSCHAAYGERDAGPVFANASLLSMKVCMDCHAEHGASNECIVCHK